MSLIKGLDIGKHAIMTQTEAVKIAGQNISNVSVPGYSRRKIELKAVIYGGGDRLLVLDARRVRDKFIDRHIRTENQSLGKWEMRSQLYSQIENVFLEPSEHGLNNALAEFWSSWEDLANNPENTAPRSVTVQHGMVIAQSINRLDSRLKDLRSVADSCIRNKVIQINDTATRIASINTQIVAAESSGDEASEIRDSRDLLIDQMSKLVNISVIEREGGSISLLIGGRTIVDAGEVCTLETQQLPSGDMMTSKIVWSDDGAAASITGGEIAGLVSVRDEIIPQILTEVGTLASTLITAVNDKHKTGYGLDGSTELNFFTGADASDIEVNDEIANSVNMVAASQSSEPGDNTIALDIATLADQNVAPGGTNIGTFYSNILNSLGTQSQSTSMMRENAETLLTYLEERKESVSGVSLDEETADLIRFQRAYESAAQYMSVVNEMIETLIDIV